MAKRHNKAQSDDDFLSDLVLWQNNPEHADRVSELAKQGNRDAQYALGLIYAEGRGRKQDEIEAYYWLSRAIQQGDEDAQLLRDIVQQQMTLEQIHQADIRAAKNIIHMSDQNA